MNGLSQLQHCTCQRMEPNQPLCDGQYSFEEKGKRVTSIIHSEATKAVPNLRTYF